MSFTKKYERKLKKDRWISQEDFLTKSILESALSIIVNENKERFKQEDTVKEGYCLSLDKAYESK